MASFHLSVIDPEKYWTIQVFVYTLYQAISVYIKMTKSIHNVEHITHHESVIFSFQLMKLMCDGGMPLYVAKDFFVSCKNTNIIKQVLHPNLR